MTGFLKLPDGMVLMMLPDVSNRRLRQMHMQGLIVAVVEPIQI